MKDPLHLGPGGFCVCPKCGERIRHRTGVPCREERCPNCGGSMLRKGSSHYKLWIREIGERKSKATRNDHGTN